VTMGLRPNKGDEDADELTVGSDFNGSLLSW
jgi:hypothetical protein